MSDALQKDIAPRRWNPILQVSELSIAQVDPSRRSQPVILGARAAIIFVQPTVPITVVGWVCFSEGEVPCRRDMFVGQHEALFVDHEPGARGLSTNWDIGPVVVFQREPTDDAHVTRQSYIGGV